MDYDGRHVRRDRRSWWGVAVACLGMTMSFLTITATVSSLSAIQADLGLSSVQLVWVSSAYPLALAALVLSAGTLGDVLGRRRVFQAGSLVLAAGAVVTATAGSAGAVVTGEVVMGAGAALVVPNSLALVAGTFGDPARRASAVGVWAACSGIGLAVGPLSAGLLLASSGWHAVFLVDVVVAVVVLAAAPLVLPDTRVPGRVLDVPGTLAAFVAVSALVVGVVEVGSDGLTGAVPVAAGALAVLALLAFVAIERRSSHPVVDLALFRSRRFTTALVVAAVALFAFTGVALVLVLDLQRVHGVTGLGSGWRLLGLMGPYVVVSALAARVVRRAGVRPTLVTGLLLTAAGALLARATGPQTSFALTWPGYLLVGVGLGLLIAPTTAAALAGLDAARTGMAGATLTTVRQVGAALGGSVLGTVVTRGYADRLRSGAGDPTAAFSAAVGDGLLVAVVVLVLAAALPLLLLRTPRTAPAEALGLVPEGSPL
ncbi:MFS transporter [Kineococcus rubinsiae]|uniref:MFS transporter n=1 Tax=Kineococcus rubinsiae TaxID=2609562 RepID=UPI00142F7383|nr:MFS transporter [Kineococcus rubinsiae]NIZ90090.1 MFS transporter [Kineococcus rubinsiae]